MNNYLARAHKAKNNEFYTEYKTMEYIFESEELGPLFCEFVKNKIIYLPCDNEDSNIYKYFVANKDRLQIKEILRTSDDYYGHLDLYEKCDLVFTNPPFTKLYKYTKWLEYDLNKKFVLWWSWASLCYANIEEFNNKKWKVLTYNGEITLYSKLNKKSVNCLIYTNIKNSKSINVPFKHSKFKLEDLPKFKKDLVKNVLKSLVCLDIEDAEGVPYINKAIEFPNNYNGFILIPVIVYLQRAEMFDYYGYTRICCENLGTLRAKVLVKLKRPENEEKVN